MPCGCERIGFNKFWENVVGGDRDPAVKRTLWTRIGLGQKFVDLTSLTKENFKDPYGNCTILLSNVHSHIVCLTRKLPRRHRIARQARETVVMQA